MSITKPFHRNYRKMKHGPNSGYSDWAYIVDRQYAKTPEHYTRAFSILQADILRLFEFIEPSDINLPTYSFRIHELLMRTCIEVEANFKAILTENIYTPTYQNKNGQVIARTEKEWNINDFKLVNKTHHLDHYTVELPFWKGNNGILLPFQEWRTGQTLKWYQAYNMSKHDRLNNFQSANLENLLLAFTGLFALLSSQFRTEDFTPGQTLSALSTDEYFNGDFGIGSYLIVGFPDNWTTNEIYDFDWSLLKNQVDRFEKIDYNNI